MGYRGYRFGLDIHKKWKVGHFIFSTNLMEFNIYIVVIVFPETYEKLQIYDRILRLSEQLLHFRYIVEHVTRRFAHGQFAQIGPSKVRLG